MMKTLTKYKCSLLLVFISLIPVLLAQAKIAENNFPAQTAFKFEKFFRTELYFGMNKPDGGTVSDEDWNEFLVAQVTPRFPEGFTVLKSYGQFKDAEGKIVREESRLLVLLYTKKSRRGLNEKIEELRAAYKKEFQQQSVLRLDFPKAVRVSF